MRQFRPWRDARAEVCSDLLLLLKDGRVVVEGVCEVVWDQVLARHAQIQRVPVHELVPQLVQVLLGDLALLGHGLSEKHKVEELACALLGRDAERRACAAIEAATWREGELDE